MQSPPEASLGVNHAEMLVDGHRLLPVLLEDLRSARREIHVAMFLFFHDPIGIELAEVLCERARAGVAVRVLLNIVKTGMGDPFSTGEKEMMDQDPNVDWNPLDVRPLCELLTAAGVEVHDTNIDYDVIPDTADARLRAMATLIKETIDLDELHVDHRKIIVIDHRVAYAGGANIGAQYLSHGAFDPAVDAKTEAEAWKREGSAEPWWKWHDSLTRFEGPVVATLDAHFRDRWILDGGAPYEVDPSPPAASSMPRGIAIEAATVVINEPNSAPNAVRDLYLERIASAERSIFIENPYLYHPTIAEALVRAKTERPELMVTLVLPSGKWNDNAFAQDAQQFYYQQFLAAGIEVHEYQNHFTHLKLAIFDERWSIHGSTNLNYRSLEDDKDFELVVLVDGVTLAKDLLRHVRDEDLRVARRFTAADVDGSLAGLRVKMRDPRTLLLLSRKML